MAWRSSHLDAHGLPPQGYWGPITSSLLWCEDKYRWSRYIAEPVNTFTNVVFIALALFGASKSIEQQLPFRFVLVNLGIALVGIGSFAFHATLTRPAQLLDELPMIYASLVVSYCVLETSKRGNPPTGGIWLPLILIAVGIFVTVGYLALPNPILHQVAYASIQLASTIKVTAILYGGASSPLNNTPAARRNRSMVRKTNAFGATVFLTGFAIWNVDNIFCDQLRLVRAHVGYPLALLVEGHAWWHILTGYGAYHLVQSTALVGMSLKEGPENYTFKDFDTLRGFLLPQVVRVRVEDKKSS